jgi:hypothetical protein
VHGGQQLQAPAMRASHHVGQHEAQAGAALIGLGIERGRELLRLRLSGAWGRCRAFGRRFLACARTRSPSCATALSVTRRRSSSKAIERVSCASSHASCSVRKLASEW